VVRLENIKRTRRSGFGVLSRDALCKLLDRFLVDLVKPSMLGKIRLDGDDIGNIPDWNCFFFCSSNRLTSADTSNVSSRRSFKDTLSKLMVFASIYCAIIPLPQLDLLLAAICNSTLVYLKNHLVQIS